MRFMEGLACRSVVYLSSTDMSWLENAVENCSVSYFLRCLTLIDLMYDSFLIDLVHWTKDI